MRDETRPVEDETIKWAMSDVAPMSDEAFDRGRAALLARIDADTSTADEAPSNVVPFRRRRRIPLVAAAAAMVLIAGAALITPSLMSRDERPNVGSAAAAEVLNKAANATGDAKLQPGQYLYVLQYARWSAMDGEYKWMYLQDQTLQTWIPADRSGTWLLPAQQDRRQAVADRVGEGLPDRPGDRDRGRVEVRGWSPVGRQGAGELPRPDPRVHRGPPPRPA